MSIYARYKRSPEGFRALVELLETTPIARRQRMIDMGMEEDAEFTERAMSYMLNFDDLIGLPDLELAELVALAPPRMTAFAIRQLPDDKKTRFLANAQPRVRAEIRDYLEVDAGPREIGGARLKLIETARQLERKGLVRVKKIP